MEGRLNKGQGVEIKAMRFILRNASKDVFAA
jgi:hypothetical protein